MAYGTGAMMGKAAADSPVASSATEQLINRLNGLRDRIGQLNERAANIRSRIFGPTPQGTSTDRTGPAVVPSGAISRITNELDGIEAGLNDLQNQLNDLNQI